MSHIDTLKVYEEYRASGYNEQKAKDLTNILEHSFMTKVKELKTEFASNKLISILGSIIILVGIGIIGLLWTVTVDLEVLKIGQQNHSTQIQQLSMKAE